MRTLTILRHAKAVPHEDFDGDDFDRPLALRGQRDAPLMGRHLRAEGLVPDLVICSPSVRTRQTTGLVLQELAPAAPRLIYEPAIYEASPDALLDCVRRATIDARHIMLVGHNPGMQRLALLLTGAPLAPEHADLARNLPTSGVVVIELDIAAWAEIRAGSGRIRHFATPRMLG